MKHKLTTVVLAGALVTVTDPAWSRSAWTQPGWATRLASTQRGSGMRQGSRHRHSRLLPVRGA
jgi:hypothetical protein